MLHKSASEMQNVDNNLLVIVFYSLIEHIPLILSGVKGFHTY